MALIHKNNIGGFLAFILFFIILPGGSWYYLQKGFDYRKEILQDLQDLGQIGDFQLVTQNGDTITRQNIEGNAAVVAFTSDGEFKEDILKWQKTIHHQFNERNDVLFITHGLKNVPEAMIDTTQWLFLNGENTAIKELALSYNLPLTNGQTVFNNPYLILLDSTQIRRYYDVRDNLQMGRLVEHLTIVMPRLEKKDIYLHRDEEK